MSMNAITALLVPAVVLVFLALMLLSRLRRRPPQTHDPDKPQVAYDAEALRRAKERGDIPPPFQ
ncbi:MAG: hypothetical protein AAFQ88_00295 [Pseudomonadota bacterium]